MSDQTTISQALRQIARLKGRVTEGKERVEASLTFRNDTPPAFQFAAVWAQLIADRSELTHLESLVAITNAQSIVTLPDSNKQVRLAEVVKTLQELKGHIGWLRALPVLSQGSMTKHETRYTEEGTRVTDKVEYTCAFPEATRAGAIDQTQQIFDTLNDLVEKKNHETLLISPS